MDLSLYPFPRAAATNCLKLGAFTTTQIRPLTALEARSLKSWWRQRWFPVGAPREPLLWAVAVPGAPWPVGASLQSPPLSSRGLPRRVPLCLQAPSPFSPNDTGYWS